MQIKEKLKAYTSKSVQPDIISLDFTFISGNDLSYRAYS